MLRILNFRVLALSIVMIMLFVTAATVEDVVVFNSSAVDNGAQTVLAGKTDTDVVTGETAWGFEAVVRGSPNVSDADDPFMVIKESYIADDIDVLIPARDSRASPTTVAMVLTDDVAKMKANGEDGQEDTFMKNGTSDVPRTMVVVNNRPAPTIMNDMDCLNC